MDYIIQPMEIEELYYADMEFKIIYHPDFKRIEEPPKTYFHGIEIPGSLIVKENNN